MQSYEKDQHEYSLWKERLKQAIEQVHLYDTVEALASIGRAITAYLSDSRLWDKDTVEPAVFTQFFTLCESVGALLELRGFTTEQPTKEHEKRAKWFNELFGEKQPI